MQIEIASSHLEHVEWLQHYYPDDLPEEWRLGYYANEFPTLLVPTTTWIADEYPVVKTWLEDVHEHFRFSFELNEALLQHPRWTDIEHDLLHCRVQSEALLLARDCAQISLLKALQAGFRLYHESDTLQIDHIALRLFVKKDEGAYIGCARITEASPLVLRHVFEKLIGVMKCEEDAQKSVLLYLDAPWSVMNNMRMMKPLLGV